MSASLSSIVGKQAKKNPLRETRQIKDDDSVLKEKSRGRARTKNKKTRKRSKSQVRPREVNRPRGRASPHSRRRKASVASPSSSSDGHLSKKKIVKKINKAATQVVPQAVEDALRSGKDEAGKQEDPLKWLRLSQGGSTTEQLCWARRLSDGFVGRSGDDSLQPFAVSVANGLKLIGLAWRFKKYVGATKKRGLVPYMDPFSSTKVRANMGVPCGGIGAGSITRGWRGDFLRPLALGAVPWRGDMYSPIDADQFSIWIRSPLLKGKGGSVARVMNPREDIPESYKDWGWGLKGENSTYKARFPRAWTEYDEFDGILKATCRQVSPVIPHNYKESSVPACVFVWTLSNTSDRPLSASVMLSFQNGFGTESDTQGGHWNRLWVPADGTGSVGVEMFHNQSQNVTRPDGNRAVVKDPLTIAIATKQGNGKGGADFVSAQTAFASNRPSKTVWRDFARSGKLKDRDPLFLDDQAKSKPGYAIASALAARIMTLEPGETREIVFSIAWDAPLVRFGSGRGYYARYTKYYPLGKYNLHGAAREMAEDALGHYQEWEAAIEEWQEPILEDPKLPEWYKVALFNELYFIAAGGSVWVDRPAADNFFGVEESLCDSFQAEFKIKPTLESADWNSETGARALLDRIVGLHISPPLEVLKVLSEEDVVKSGIESMTPTVVDSLAGLQPGVEYMTSVGSVAFSLVRRDDGVLVIGELVELDPIKRRVTRTEPEAATHAPRSDRSSSVKKKISSEERQAKKRAKSQSDGYTEMNAMRSEARGEAVAASVDVTSSSSSNSSSIVINSSSNNNNKKNADTPQRRRKKGKEKATGLPIGGRTKSKSKGKVKKASTDESVASLSPMAFAKKNKSSRMRPSRRKKANTQPRQRYTEKKETYPDVGRFAYLEGHEYLMFNTYDVHFYASFALAMLWPWLEISMQRDIASATLKSDTEERLMMASGKHAPRKLPGAVPHDLGAPTRDPWHKVNAYNIHDVSCWKDLNSKFVLMVMRDYMALKRAGGCSFKRGRVTRVLPDRRPTSLCCKPTRPMRTFSTPAPRPFGEVVRSQRRPEEKEATKGRRLEGLGPRGEALETSPSPPSKDAPLAFLRDMWPVLELVIERLSSFDKSGNGMIQNEGFPDQTYDAWPVQGTSAYCGGLWVHALGAMSQMARELGRPRKADTYEQMAKKAAAVYEKELWNSEGRYYNYDASKSPHSDSIMADQLAGHWYATACGLPPLLDLERVKEALETVYKHNVMLLNGGSMGAINGMRPSGEIDRTSLQSQEVWTGTTFGLAATMMQEGLEDRAFKTAEGLVHSVYNTLGYWFQTPEAWTQDGKYRSIGYMRPLAIWSMQWAVEQRKTQGGKLDNKKE